MLSATLLLAVFTQGLAVYDQTGESDGYGGDNSYSQGAYNGYGPAPAGPAVPAPAGPAPAPGVVNSLFDVTEYPEPAFTTTPPEAEEGPGPTLSPSDSTTKHVCQMIIPPECTFPFEYKGLTYSTCTGVDTMQTMWCSTAKTYGGKWKQCKDPCKNKWSVKAIAGAVVAGSVAATGVGLIGAAIAHNKNNNKPLFGGAAATPAPAAAPVTGIPVVEIIRPAVPGVPGLEEKITPVVEARLLEAAPASKTFLPQQSATIGAAESNTRLAGIFVLGAVVILSVGVALYAGLSRKKRVHAEKDEQAYSQISQ